MEHVFGWITEYGYPALFMLLLLGILGLPLPDEALLMFAGYLVFKKDLTLAPTMLVAFLGSTSGMTISYGLGRSLGCYATRTAKRLLPRQAVELDHAQAWYAGRGRYVLLGGYFVPGVRHLTALAAGLSRLPLGEFALFAYSGGLLWSGSFVALGYFAGEEWAHLSDAVHRSLLLGAGGVFTVLVIVYILLARRP